MKKSHRSIGDVWEDIALQYLEKKGYTLLDRNFSVIGGEIDIIVKKDGIFVFVEVKYRRNLEFWHPFESISARKKSSLKRAIIAYANAKYIDLDDCRFDAIGIVKKDDGWHRLFHMKWVEI